MGLFSTRRVKMNSEQLKSLLFTYITGNSPVVLYNYDQRDFISKGYSSNAEIYSIIKKITDKCNVSAPYVYIDKKGVKSKFRKGGKDTVYSVAKHRLDVSKTLDYAPDDNDLSKLIKNPNDFQTWREFITLLRIFYFVQGESFVYRESGDDDCAISLHLAPSHFMNPVVSGMKITGWKLTNMDGTKRNLDANDVMHFKMPNPNFDNLRGMSPLLAGLKYLQLDDKSIEGWIKTLENEGAKGIVSPSHQNPELWLTPQQRELAQQRVDEKISGYGNRNRVVVSSMPLQYTQIGLSPDAMNIVNGLNKAGYKLCDLWNVPAVLFDPNPTYENQKAASRRLVLDVVLPYLNGEEDKFNSWLVEPFSNRDKRNYVFDYDLSAYEELRLSVSDTDAFLKTHTINEVRVMLGSDEIDEEYANQVLVQQGLVPLSDYSIDEL